MARKDTNQMSLFGATEGELAMIARGFEYTSGSPAMTVWHRGTVCVRISYSAGIMATDSKYGTSHAAASLSLEDVEAIAVIANEMRAFCA